MKPILCKNCLNWYHPTQADQCDFKDNFEYNIKRNDYLSAVYGKEKSPINKLNFYKDRSSYYNKFNSISYIKGNICGHPSELNKNNDCIFFTKIPWYKIPLKWMGVL